MFAADTPSAVITAIGGLVLAGATFLGALTVATRRQNGKVDQAKSAAAQARTSGDMATATTLALAQTIADVQRRAERAEAAVERCLEENRRLREDSGGTGRSRS